MGFLRDLFRGETNALVQAAAAPTFAVDDSSMPAEVFGISAFVNPTPYAPKIDRRSAMSVPAVKRCRDLIAGTLGGLPIDVTGGAGDQVRWNLLEQPEQNVPRSVTMTRLFEDLLLEAVAWWQITEFAWNGYPSRVKRLDPRTVGVTDGRVYVNGKHVPDDQLIRFDSPTDALLVAGARAIRTCLTLDAAAARAADGTPPMETFTPSSDVDPFEDDEETVAFLTGYAEARRQRTAAYIPAALKHDLVGWNPEQLQLADARQHAVLEVARLAGVDGEDVGVSTTSRTYQNAQDRRKQFTDFTLGQYRQAVEDRLRMGDVTPRNYSVRFNLSSFLRSDDLTRMQTYKLGLEVGAFDGRDEVRALEGGAPLSSPAPTTDPSREDDDVSASATTAHTFDDAEPELRLDAPADGAAFEVDTERRVIRGLAVPYGVVGISNGQRWQFSQGSVTFADVRRVKLWVQHDKNRAVGVATKLEDRPDGLFAEFKVARGAEGDLALSLAEDGVLDGLSIGVKAGGKFRTRAGVNHAIEAPLMEVSLTPAPSFDDARIHAVAASAANERNTMKCSKCGIVHAPGVVECNAADVTNFEAEQRQDDAPTFDVQPITDAIRDGFAALGNPQGAGREHVGAGESFEVDEAPCYRFDGVPGAHSLVDDMRQALGGDSVARQRIDEFFNEQFAVTTGNVASLNPTENRPDLFTPNLQYSRPLWESVSTGTITDKTPFTVPRFASATGLVGPHVEGVEPTPGAMTTTAQTITPGGVSGKVEVNREVLDQGGSPQADAILWAEMLNGYFEGIETRIATRLAAVPTTEVGLAGAVDTPLIDAVTNIFTGLQFVRGGNRFTRFVSDGMLFPALVNAKDGQGRKHLPVLGPTNAQGQTAGGFDRVQLGSQEIRAAWALGATPASKSYLFVPSSVWAWASAPRRFNFEYQLKSIDIGIWGYGAEAVLRDTDVRPIDYTTADA